MQILQINNNVSTFSRHTSITNHFEPENSKTQEGLYIAQIIPGPFAFLVKGKIYMQGNGTTIINCCLKMHFKLRKELSMWDFKRWDMDCFNNFSIKQFTLKVPIMNAADDSPEYFFYCFSEKIRLDVSCKSSAM